MAHTIAKTGALAATLILAVSGTSALAQTMMSAEELAAYVTGKSYTGVNPENGEPVATVVYNEDGTSVLTFPDGQEEAGSYRLDGDSYCTRYAAFRENSENCFRLEPIGGGETQAWYTDGSMALRLVPAN
ncbi:MAG: hypothetical protein AAFW98_14355 [Pseudomonadota bacterium]